MALLSETDPVFLHIAEVLRRELPADTIVDVSPSGIRDNIHVLVVSRELDELSETQKQERLWGVLEDATRRGELKEADLKRISVILPVSIKELRR